MAKAIQIELTEDDVQMFMDIVNDKVQEIIWSYPDEVTGEAISVRFIKEKEEE